MNQTKTCKFCGAVATYKEGHSKEKNKDWKGYFCANKQDCGQVEWIRTNGKGGGNNSNGFQILADEIADFRRHFDKRMDGLAVFMQKKTGQSPQSQKGENPTEFPFSEDDFGANAPH